LPSSSSGRGSGAWHADEVGWQLRSAEGWSFSRSEKVWLEWASGTLTKTREVSTNQARDMLLMLMFFIFRSACYRYGSVFHLARDTWPPNGPCPTSPSSSLHPTNPVWSPTLLTSTETSPRTHETPSLHHRRAHNNPHHDIGPTLWPLGCHDISAWHARTRVGFEYGETFTRVTERD
jgi:hypothetical protein